MILRVDGILLKSINLTTAGPGSCLKACPRGPREPGQVVAKHDLSGVTKILSCVWVYVGGVLLLFSTMGTHNLRFEGL